MLVIVRRLDDERHSLELGRAQQVREGVAADGALAEVGVAVAGRAAWGLGVVQVHASDALGAETRAGLGEYGVDTLRRVDGVAGGVQVAGVEADPERLAGGGLVGDCLRLLGAAGA